MSTFLLSLFGHLGVSDSFLLLAQLEGGRHSNNVKVTILGSASFIIGVTQGVFCLPLHPTAICGGRGPWRSLAFLLQSVQFPLLPHLVIQLVALRFVGLLHGLCVLLVLQVHLSRFLAAPLLQRPLFLFLELTLL